MNNAAAYEQIEQLLAVHVAEMRQTSGKDLTVARMRPLLACLGNPEQSLRVIHVAGTSGKTSTSYYLADLLQRHGSRVGLTVSPHIDSITERVQMNGRPVSVTYFLDALHEVLDRLKGLDFRPTYFEVLIALSLWCFAREQVHYAVLETGLGGRSDATNVADKPDKIAVITDIGLDHMAILGNTIQEIAWQKAGIIHPGNQVFMYRQAPEIDQVITQQVAAAGKGAAVHFVSPRAVASMPLFQSRNWMLAREVARYVAKRDGLNDISSLDLKVSQDLIIPGRLNVFRSGQRTIIVDGAHNEQKMVALIATLKSRYPNERFATIAGFKQGKEYQSALRHLSTIASRLVAVPIADSNAAFAKSVPPAEISQHLSEHSNIPVTVRQNIRQALELLTATSDDQPILIAGSLYLAAQARQVLDISAPLAFRDYTSK